MSEEFWRVPEEIAVGNMPLSLLRCAVKEEAESEHWLTKDNQLLLIDSMEENHLRNVLRMIIRQKDQEEEEPYIDMWGN